MDRLFAVLATVFFLILAQEAPVLGQEANANNTKMQVARELMTVTGAKNSFDSMMGLVGAQITNLIASQNRGKEKLIRKIMGTILAEMSDRKDEIISKVAGIYAKQFTIPEMHEIIAFYKTPIGKKMVARLPVIMRESMRFGQAWGQKMGTDVFKRFKEKARDKGLKL